MPDFSSHFESLPVAEPHPRGRRKARICIATVDVAGPYHCGGVGAAYQGLALAMAERGHEVTLVYTHHAIRGGEPHWRSWYERRGIRFQHVPQPPPLSPWYGRRKEASFVCYRHLKDGGPYDVIHFHEWLGLPYYSLLAKRQGLAFENTTLCVGTHGALRWSRAGDEEFATNRDDLVVDFMERRSVELADVVISPSRFLLDWMRADGWNPPARSYVAQNVLGDEGPVPASTREVAAASEPAPVDELVFFGRLDRRKGLFFFFDVLDRLAADGKSMPAVTFLGSSVAVGPRLSDELIRSRAARWPFETKIMSDTDRDEALAYLSAPGRLAVIPSLADNLPCTVHECALAGIPFLASNVGGIPEIVEPAAHGRALAPLETETFATRIREILRDGQSPASLQIAPRETADRWSAWHEDIAAAPDERPAARSSETREEPFVSICMAHFESPDFLPVMLDSLRAQTWPDTELILVDDGSRSDAAKRMLAALEPEFEERGWKLLRSDNRGPGAARHAAAEAARGDFLLFVDDDDWAEPHAVETFARVAARTGADVLVSAYRGFESKERPGPDTAVKQWHLPLGPALAAGLIYPELGGTMIFASKDAYFDCGGFPTDRDADEDWELLLALAAGGYDLQVIPEPLFWYRETGGGRSRTDNRFERARSRIRLFERMLPVELRDLAQLAYVQLSGAHDAESLQRTDRVRALLDKAAARKKK